MTDIFRLTLLGTGSSGGVPRVGGIWGACDPGEAKNHRRRCAALVARYNRTRPEAVTRILIDTPPDLRMQLLDAGIVHLDGLVYTHDHADQTHGIDDIRPLVIADRVPLKTYMDAVTRTSLVDRFRYCFEGKGDYPPILDLQPDIRVGEPFTIKGAGGGITLLPLDQEHGRIRSLGFRVGRLAYCNDVSDMPASTLAALKGLDLLVLDALRPAPHPSHAHVAKALQWIEQLQPRQAVLTNLHIDLDYNELRRELPPNVQPGHDGWSLEIPV